MKKIVFFIPLMFAVLASCNKETADGSAQAVTYIEDGLSIVAGAEMSKVTVNIDDERVNPSYMSWEAGDHISVFHNGRSYDFVTATSGETALFYPVDANNAITTIVPEQPLIAYYNVTSVAANGTATFSIPAEQTEGELSNKVPLYAYSATTEPVNNRVQLSFNPMASVLEFKLSAAPAPLNATTPSKDPLSYELTKVVLTPASGASGYTVMSSGTVNPATGAITPSSSSLSAMTYHFAASTDIAGEDGQHFQLVIGKCQMTNTGAVMDWYKGDILNYTKSIWASKDIDFSSAYKHVYQPIAQKVVGLGNFSDYYSKFYANRNSQGNYINYCDDERNLILTGDISMLGGTTPETFRSVTITGLTWNLDGKGHKIFNFLATDAKRISCLFSNLQADIRNVTFGATGTSPRNSIDVSDTNGKGAYVGGSFGIVSDLVSGTLENITTYLDWTVTVHAEASACYLGGLVGNMKGGTLRNCYNRGSVSLVLYDGLTTSANLIAGGLVGNSGTTPCTLENCENHAAVSVSSCSTGAIFAAGIIGANFQGFSASGCKNYGNITVTNTNTTDQSSVSTAQCRAAGIISNVSSSPTNSIIGCANYGDITGVLAAKVKGYQIGGIAGNFYSNAGSIAGTDTETGRIQQRGNVYAYVAGEFDSTAACWFAQFCTNGMSVYADVLKGTKVNTTTISASNYYQRNIWSRADNPGTLGMLTE